MCVCICIYIYIYIYLFIPIYTDLIFSSHSWRLLFVIRALLWQRPKRPAFGATSLRATRRGPYKGPFILFPCITPKYVNIQINKHIYIYIYIYIHIHIYYIYIYTFECPSFSPWRSPLSYQASGRRRGWALSARAARRKKRHGSQGCPKHPKPETLNPKP